MPKNLEHGIWPLEGRAGGEITEAGMSSRYQRGDIVVYARQKASESPGPRARDVSPADAGETYTYIVDKFWIVAEVLNDGHLRVRTRGGKEHRIAVDDRRLRRVSLLERLFMRGKFPKPAVLEPK